MRDSDDQEPFPLPTSPRRGRQKKQISRRQIPNLVDGDGQPLREPLARAPPGFDDISYSSDIDAVSTISGSSSPRKRGHSPDTAITSAVAKKARPASSRSGPQSKSRISGQEFFSLERFEKLLKQTLSKKRTSLKEIENEVKSSGKNFGSLQYGRMLPFAVEKVFDLLNLSGNDVFLDIGSGIGTIPLQALCTRGCESRGVEILVERHNHAVSLAKSLSDIVPEGLEVDRLDFRCNDIKSTKSAKAFSVPDGSSIKAFMNNFEGLLGTRSDDASKGKSVEDYVAGRFASWPEGSMLVTVSELFCLGASQEVATTALQKHRLAQKGDLSHASFFEVKKIKLGPQNELVSWSEGSGATQPLFAFKYTRVGQNGAKKSVFRCTNRDCESAKAGKAIQAFKLVGGVPFLRKCSCGIEPRGRRLRQSVPAG
jgi:hypothetical protein